MSPRPAVELSGPERWRERGGGGGGGDGMQHMPLSTARRGISHHMCLFQHKETNAHYNTKTDTSRYVYIIILSVANLQ